MTDDDQGRDRGRSRGLLVGVEGEGGRDGLDLEEGIQLLRHTPRVLLCQVCGISANDNNFERTQAGFFKPLEAVCHFCIKDMMFDLTELKAKFFKR